jgi:hypothetical protein
MTFVPRRTKGSNTEGKKSNEMVVGGKAYVRTVGFKFSSAVTVSAWLEAREKDDLRHSFLKKD